MERYEGKVALVTGCSSGSGAVITRYLVDYGMIVVGLARRENKLQELAEQLENKKGKFYPIKLDVVNEQEIYDAFAWIEENLGGIHVLINNAGQVSYQNFTEFDSTTLRQVIAVNVTALVIFSKEAIKSMRAHGIDDGQIIISSSYGAKMSSPLPGFAVYSGSKRAVQAINRGLRLELANDNSNIKVSVICPCTVDTGLFEASLPFPLSLARSKPHIQPEQVADAMIFCLKMKPSVHVTEIDIRPNMQEYSQPFVE